MRRRYTGSGGNVRECYLRGPRRQVHMKRSHASVAQPGAVFLDLETYGVDNHICGTDAAKRTQKESDWKRHLGDDTDPPIAIGHPNRVTVVVVWTQGKWYTFEFERELMAEVDNEVRTDGKSRAETAKDLLDSSAGQQSTRLPTKRQMMINKLTRIIKHGSVLVSYKGNGPGSLDVRFLHKLLGIPVEELSAKMVDPFFMFCESLQNATQTNGLPGKSASGADAVGMALRGKYDKLAMYCMTDVHLMMILMKQADGARWQHLVDKYRLQPMDMVSMVSTSMENFNIVYCSRGRATCPLPLVKMPELRMQHHVLCIIGICCTCKRALTPESSKHELASMEYMCESCMTPSQSV